MGDLRKQLEDILSSIAFAEEGEHEAALEILRGKKKILLAISERIFDGNALKYALSLSRRIGADIDILYLAGSAGENLELDQFVSAAKREGAECTVVRKRGCMKKAILDYTEKRKEILFVIVGTESELTMECDLDEKTFESAWGKLKCPLVVVSKAISPSAA
jgi:hypothetical protein